MQEELIKSNQEMIQEVLASYKTILNTWNLWSPNNLKTYPKV